MIRSVSFIFSHFIFLLYLVVPGFLAANNELVDQVDEPYAFQESCCKNKSTVSYNPFNFLQCTSAACCSYPYRFYLAHREGDGIGYNGGYTTAGIFLAPWAQPDNVNQPFFDGKFHLFNDGRMAANAGVGTRFFLPNRECVIGINGYYDYRRDHHQDYHQLGIGLEAFTQCLEYRINAYFPLSKKKQVFDKHVFDDFSGGYYFISAKQSVIYGGVDAEIGTWLQNKCCSNALKLYLGAGPYCCYRSHYENCCSKERAIYGGRVRIIACLCRWLSINVTAEYDSVWKSRAQAQLVLCFPIGCGFSGQTCEDGCGYNGLQRATTQPVYRQDIIALKNDRVYSWNW